MIWTGTDICAYRKATRLLSFICKLPHFWVVTFLVARLYLLATTSNILALPQFIVSKQTNHTIMCIHSMAMIIIIYPPSNRSHFQTEWSRKGMVYGKSQIHGFYQVTSSTTTKTYIREWSETNLFYCKISNKPFLSSSHLKVETQKNQLLHQHFLQHLLQQYLRMMPIQPI